MKYMLSFFILMLVLFLEDTMAMDKINPLEGKIVTAQPFPPNNTLSDIFVKLPEVYFDAFTHFNAACKLTKKVRQDLLNTRKNEHLQVFTFDPQNGYMHFGTYGDGDGIYANLTYWQFDKSILVGLVINDSGNCMEVSNKVFFLEYKEEKFTDVSELFNPKLTLKSFDVTQKEAIEKFKDSNVTSWELPQKGKTIKIFPLSYDCSDFFFEGSPVLYELTPKSIKTFSIVKKAFNNEKRE